VAGPAPETSAAGLVEHVQAQERAQERGHVQQTATCKTFLIFPAAVMPAAVGRQLVLALVQDLVLVRLLVRAVRLQAARQRSF
jgi:hypothetical protein